MCDKITEKRIDVIEKAIIFMFEQGKNELLQIRHQLEQTLQKEVMLGNPMVLSVVKNQEGILELPTINNQLSEPLRRLDEKIAELDAHIQALKGEDDSN
jgi:hypothetical protein